MEEAKIEFKSKDAQQVGVLVGDLVNRGILKSVSYGPPIIKPIQGEMCECLKEDLTRKINIANKEIEHLEREGDLGPADPALWATITKEKEEWDEKLKEVTLYCLDIEKGIL